MRTVRDFLLHGYVIEVSSDRMTKFKAELKLESITYLGIGISVIDALDNLEKWITKYPNPEDNPP